MADIKKKVYKMFIDEEDMDSGVFAISLVENPAIEANWITLSKQHSIKLATADTEKRILLGPVLIPNKLIPRLDEQTGEEYDIQFDAPVIEKAAQLYMQRQHNNDATLEHADTVEDTSVVESWIIDDPKLDKQAVYGLSYPKGTWMVMMKVNNPTIWEDYVKNGVVKGFSLEGLFGHNLVEASKQAHFTALSDLNDIFDSEYAEEMLATMKGIIKKDGRLKTGQRVELESYNDYPDTVKNAAQKGIDLNAKVNNKCATTVGKLRAQQLANGRAISAQTIQRMYAYTSRAREFYNPDDNTACGTISYLLWGGDAANRWSAAKLKELGLFNGETAVSVGSSYAGQFGPGKKYKAPAQLATVPTAKLDVFGYIPAYFTESPEITQIFTDLVTKNPDAATQDLIKAAAVSADKLLHLEKKVIKAGMATISDLENAKIFADDYRAALKQVDSTLGTTTDVSYIGDHLDTISSYIDTSLSRKIKQHPAMLGIKK